MTRITRTLSVTDYPSIVDVERICWQLRRRNRFEYRRDRKIRRRIMRLNGQQSVGLWRLA